MFGIDCAVSILDGPELSEHRRKELALARLMAEAIGIMLYTGCLLYTSGCATASEVASTHSATATASVLGMHQPCLLYTSRRPARSSA